MHLVIVFVIAGSPCCVIRAVQ